MNKLSSSGKSPVISGSYCDCWPSCLARHLKFGLNLPTYVTDVYIQIVVHARGNKGRYCSRKSGVNDAAELVKQFNCCLPSDTRCLSACSSHPASDRSDCSRSSARHCQRRVR